MEVFAKIRENNKIIGKLVGWQKTAWYPALYAALGVFAASFGMAAYIPVFWIYAASVVFAALFGDDVKVMLVPLFLSYYAIGDDKDLTIETSKGDVFEAFAPAGLANMIICGCIMVAALVYKCAVTGVLKDAFGKRGICTVGVLCMAGACLLNGIFSPVWEPMNFAVGVLEAAGISLLYFVVLAMTDKTDDIIAYACKIMVCLGFMVTAEVFILSLRLNAEDMLFVLDEAGEIIGFQRDNTVFAWGVFNITGAVLALTVPASMYLAYGRRLGVLGYAAAVLFFAATVYVNGRTAIVFGAAALLICIVICCIGGRNRVANRIFTGAFVVALGVTWLVMMGIAGGFEELIAKIHFIFRFDNADSGRIELWEDGMRDFLSAPVFGVGFIDGGYNGDAVLDNIYSNFYHNIGVELLGALGVVGVLAFVVLLKDWLELVIRRFTFDKLLLCLMPALVVAMSLLDNFFWYLNIQIFFCAFLALSERRLEELRAERIAAVRPVPGGRKPRVVFTLVEAGKGHIVPAAAVCRAFREKYGDRTEVVESRFYTETGNAKMEDFEKGFALAVKMQSRNGILGKLCRIGNFLAGDALGQQFLMAMTAGGIMSRRAASAHLKELDADLLFTTHWATAFYSKRMKPHPYTMLFCPDVYSNGMFNMDCNDFLIPTREGLKALGRRRMYAGGNATAVPFPIREEAEEYVGRKEELKKELGADGTFAVTLCDGGYGMARLEETVTELARSDKKMTLFALCGTNDELVGRLKRAPTSPTVRIVPVGFTDDALKYIAAADVFVGKGGANSMAEPAYFGVPVIITKCITYIEKGMKKYYVNKVRGGLYIPDAKAAAAKVNEFAADPSLLRPYAENMASLHGGYGAGAIADLIWKRVEALPRA